MKAAALLAGELAGVAGKLRQSTVKIRQGREGIGSGVVWSADGVVITNAHVVRHRSLTVELAGGRQVMATLSTRDPSRDLAALRVGASGLEPAAINTTAHLRAGELVFALGNPLGLTGAVSTGIIHAVGPVPGFEHQDWVQADVQLAPGNSGGPLADVRGRVVGINTMIFNGLGLAIPASSVERFLRGEPDHPKLGVTVQVTAAGLVVADVERGTAAYRAGLTPGDLLVGLKTRADLAIALRRGPHLILDVLRGGRQQTIEVVLR